MKAEGGSRRELDADLVLEKLKEAGVEHLYHANTVRTACTFIRQGALLARGTLDERGLEQTPQESDRKDQRFGLWYDVFLDTQDLSEVFDRPNVYGPVLFVISADLLSEDWLSSLWITKNNPYYWRENMPYEERFLTQEEFESDYDPTDQRSDQNMLVLRHVGGVVRLGEHLERIIIDDPGCSWPSHRRYDLLVHATGALKSATRAKDSLEIEGEDLEVRPRHDEYETFSGEELKRLFGP